MAEEGVETGTEVMGVDTTVDNGTEATEVNDVTVCVTLAAMIV